MLNTLNGKKTAIASGILIASVLVQEVLIGIWGLEVDWLPKVVQTLNWVGGALGGIGLAHKAAKKVQVK